jgi:hypothetical protein
VPKEVQDPEVHRFTQIRTDRFPQIGEDLCNLWIGGGKPCARRISILDCGEYRSLLDIAAGASSLWGMCRNIRPLFNFEPPASDAEIEAAALQFVRKISGFTKPSHSNEAAFNEAVRDVAQIARTLIDSLQTSAPPKDRAVQAQRARERSRIRFAERAHG